jgi:hypothetical protein
MMGCGHETAAQDNAGIITEFRANEGRNEVRAAFRSLR